MENFKKPSYVNLIIFMQLFKEDKAVSNPNGYIYWDVRFEIGVEFKVKFIYFLSFFYKSMIWKISTNIFVLVELVFSNHLSMILRW